MPCHGGFSEEQIKEEKAAEHHRRRMNSIAESTLCAIFRSFDDDDGVLAYLGRIGCYDDESGLTKESVAEWWSDHQERDQTRKRKEQRQLREEIRRRGVRIFDLKRDIEQLEKELRKLEEQIEE